MGLTFIPQLKSQPPKSGQIDSYNKDTKVLTVEFKKSQPPKSGQIDSYYKDSFFYKLNKKTVSTP